MPDNTFISVCTPVYNGERFLEQCIKGVLAQRHENFEYIIVDNASTDRTPEIIESFRVQDSRIKVFRNPSTVPVIDNFRTCAGHCSDNAAWIKYALADDYLYPNCIEEMLRVGHLSERIGIVSAYRLYGGHLTNAGLSPDQDIFDGFHFYDLDFCLRLAEHGKLIVTKDISVMHHSGGKYDSGWEEYSRRFLEKHKDRLPANCSGQEPGPEKRIRFENIDMEI